MKKFRLTAFVLAVSCIMTCIPFGFGYAAAPSYLSAFAATGTPVTSEIILNGQGTGVYLTQISNTSGGLLHSGKDVNIIEADLSNVNLTVEAADTRTLGSSYTKSVENFVPLYNAADNGSTVLGAVNGNWFTMVQNGTGAFYLNAGLRDNARYALSYGVNIVNGEIYTSQLTGKEALCTASGSDVVDGPYTFGITDLNQPVIGELKVVTTIRNCTQYKTFEADGINRAPVPGSLMVYNKRMNGDSNYTNLDAYEVVIKADGDTSFITGRTVRGTVLEIYPAGSEERPGLSDDTIILTARGSEQIEMISDLQVLDEIEITAEIFDRMGGDTALWNTVRFTVGGTNLILKDGLETSFSMNEDNYPANIIGYKDDGTFVMCTVTKHEDGRGGIWNSEYVSFCKAVGFNTCFMLDGGGSATMVTLGDDGYIRRTSNANDNGNGTYGQRNVAEALMIVYKDEPVCAAQGSLNHIKNRSLFGCTQTDDVLEIPGSEITWKLGNSDGRILSYNSDGFPVIKAGESALAWPVAYLPTTVSKTDYPYAELYYYVNEASMICALTSVDGSFMNEGINAPGDVTLQHMPLSMVSDISRPVFAISGEVVFVKIVFFKSSSARTDYIESSVDFIDDFSGNGEYLKEINIGNIPSVNIATGTTYASSAINKMRLIWTPSRIGNGDVNANSAIIARQFSDSDNLVMKVSGNQWFTTDKGYKYKTYFSSDIRREATDGFSGVILNYGDDYTGYWAGTVTQNDYYYTEFSSASSPSSEATFAMATGFGFTFRKDSDRYLRVFVRTLNGTEFDVIYYDFDAGEGVSLNDYHNYAFYNDTPAQTAYLFFDGRLAASVVYSGGVQLSGQATTFGRTLDEYYYRTASIKDASGTVKASTSKALISNTGKIAVSSVGSGTVAYYDNIAVKSYLTLPSEISVDISMRLDADLSASALISLPETMRADTEARFSIGEETETVHTEKADSSWISEYFSGIDMECMTDTVTVEVVYMGTAVYTDYFTAEEYLINTARMYPKYETFIADLIDLGAALQEYRGYKLDNKADKGSLRGTEEPELNYYWDNSEVTVQGNDSDRIVAANIYIDSSIHLAFRFKASEAVTVEVDGKSVPIQDIDGYYVYTDPVSPVNFERTVTVSLKNGSGVILSQVKYSVADYLLRKQSGSIASDVVECMIKLLDSFDDI